MRKKRWVRIVTLLVFCCILFSCGKENSSTAEAEKGSVYGTVTYLATGDPVDNASVRLKPGYQSGHIHNYGQSNQHEHSWLTGYDGTYEFLDVEPGKYHITVFKTEYDDLIDDFVIEVKDGERIRRDVQIEKLPVVYTYEATTSTSEYPYSVTFNGYVASEGSPVYVERGFCYGLDYQTKVPVSGNGIGPFFTTVTAWYNIDWYKAYIVSSSGQCIYGETVYIGWK